MAPSERRVELCRLLALGLVRLRLRDRDQSSDQSGDCPLHNSPDPSGNATTRDRNPIIAKVRARVEHPFRMIKRQFGYPKTRYRGLAKNPAQLFTLFALGNLFLVRRRLLA